MLQTTLSAQLNPLLDRVCKSRGEEVSSENVTMLLVDENDDTRNSKLSCRVSLEAVGGSLITSDLIVDTGSGISILPEHNYKTHFTSPETQKKNGYLHERTNCCSWLFCNCW